MNGKGLFQVDNRELVDLYGIPRRLLFLELQELLMLYRTSDIYRLTLLGGYRRIVKAPPGHPPPKLSHG